MEIYLRQRSGIVCLITIALLLVFSHLYNHSSASRRFRILGVIWQQTKSL